MSTTYIVDGIFLDEFVDFFDEIFRKNHPGNTRAKLAPSKTINGGYSHV